MIKIMVQKAVSVLRRIPQHHGHRAVVPGLNFGATPCGCSAASNTFRVPGNSIKHEVGAAGTRASLSCDFSSVFCRLSYVSTIFPEYFPQDLMPPFGGRTTVSGEA